MKRSSRANIFYSSTQEEYYSKELIVQQNTLIHIRSGEMKVVAADISYNFHAGDTILFPKDQLGKVTKYPLDGMPYKSVAVYFPTEVLEKYYATQTNIKPGTPKINVLKPHPLLDSLFDSLYPYFNLSDALPEDIAAIKVQEAINILRSLDKDVDAILHHFAAPGKIDLFDFMQQNYMYNLPIERFGYLTGRSLTTFKRDFQKTFGTSPQKWLTQKRLEQAHYLIYEKKERPSDVYFEVGFANLSHFSFAFKKFFGYTPSGHTLIK